MLHALIGEHLPEGWADWEPAQVAGSVKVGIETDRGPWVAALVAAGYEVFAINPKSVARYRERHSTSGAKSDSADAHVLAEIVRLDRAHHRPPAGDSDQGEAIKLTARSHQSLIWDRTRHVLRLRSALREFFPAALRAFPDLDAPDALELLRRAPDPDQAAWRHWDVCRVVVGCKAPEKGLSVAPFTPTRGDCPRSVAGAPGPVSG